MKGAYGPPSDHQAGTGLDQQEQNLEHHEDEGALGLPLEHQEIRLHECFVCRKVIRTKVQRHVLKQHLPWFWAPHTACWKCDIQEAQPGSLAQRHTMIHGTDGCVFDEEHMHMWCKLMLGSFHQLQLWLESETLDDLVTYILDRELYTFVRSSFNPQELQLLTFFCLSHVTFLHI